MRIAAFAFALMAFFTGMIAAWRWLQSSQVPVDPGWRLPGEGGGIEPLDESGKAMGWSLAATQAFSTASELNRKAALWTATSVLLGGISSAVGNWPFGSG